MKRLLNPRNMYEKPTGFMKGLKACLKCPQYDRTRLRYSIGELSTP